MAGLVPAIHVGPHARLSPRCWRPIGKPWAACEPNHVDGRDKPGHDGKWHGKQDLTSFFLSSVAKQPRGRGTQPLGCFVASLLAMTYKASHRRSYPRIVGMQLAPRSGPDLLAAGNASRNDFAPPRPRSSSSGSTSPRTSQTRPLRRSECRRNGARFAAGPAPSRRSPFVKPIGAQDLRIGVESRSALLCRRGIRTIDPRRRSMCSMSAWPSLPARRSAACSFAHA